MATAGEKSRGPDTNESYRDVLEALQRAISESPINATMLTKVVDESDYSRATVNKRLGEIVDAGDGESGKYNGTTYYWIEEEAPGARPEAQHSGVWMLLVFGFTALVTTGAVLAQSITIPGVPLGPILGAGIAIQLIILFIIAFTGYWGGKIRLSWEPAR